MGDRVSSKLPKGSRLWEVEGIPVAELPRPEGGMSIRAFDPEPRPFPSGAVSRKGAAIAPEDWDDLVDSFRHHTRT